ncbi:predicted protein [Nematostella vectensis]|uniref:Galactosylceramide sulfotransferase-like n=1 Tax=Nematostella vectensis TaxID=45351 RepID=A7T9E9_NEMVE|nr:predicted protein [Nematostella vectensis]|eukprot:XP_001619478.1 hypothetical protein NEMVEDRAFT_v1g224144 [Nematostella vectensis]
MARGDDRRGRKKNCDLSIARAHVAIYGKSRNRGNTAREKRLPSNTASVSPCELDRPERNIILVKTHRTGTSTLANILYRAGDLNNLQFALPKRKTYEFYWPLRFNPSFVDKQYLNASRPNLLINAKYEQSAMSMMIGKFFDLGLMHKYFSDDHVINSTMAELSKALDLVLISEYFDESLVLLTRLLCWELDDVVYFRLRNRANDYRELDITAEMQI